MRFKIDYNSQNEYWEVRDNLCCDQIVGRHPNARNAQKQLEYEESLWNRFDSETHEMHVEHWCLFYSIDKNVELNASTIGAISTLPQ